MENVIGSGVILNTGTILVGGLNEAAVSRVIRHVQNLNPRHALLRFKNVGALGRYDAQAEVQNPTMHELERLSAHAIGAEPSALRGYDRVKGQIEPNTRLFPIDLTSRPGRGLWVKLTDWQSNGAGFVDPDSKRRGRITQEFQIAPFFEHVTANQGGY